MEYTMLESKYLPRDIRVPREKKGTVLHNAYAGPFGIWGPWVTIYEAFNTVDLRVRGDTIQTGRPAFIGEFEYIARDGKRTTRTHPFPGTILLKVGEANAESVSAVRARFKSTWTGQGVRIFVTD